MKKFFLTIPGGICLLGLILLVVIGGYPGVAAADARLVMQIVISGVVLLAALIIILSGRYPDAHQKWAFATVGTVVGYWLPSAS